MEIYLDNSATTYPKPETVYLAVDSYMRQMGVSAGRGNYKKAMAAEKLLYETRKNLSRLFDAAAPSQFIFTHNATESINMVLKGYIEAHDEVVTSTFEHNALWRPLMHLQAEKSVVVKSVDMAGNGPDVIRRLAAVVTEKTRLIAFAHGSNVTGELQPAGDIISWAHENGIAVLLDGAQTAGALPFSLSTLDPDFFAFTGHKGLLGPMGTGGLYIKKGVYLKSYNQGGTGSSALSPTQPDSLPERLEAGTMNMPGIAGLNAALQFLLEKGLQNVRIHEQHLTALLFHGLHPIEGTSLSLLGPPSAENRLGLISFQIRNADSYHAAAWLDNHCNIMVRGGLHCAPQAHKNAGTVDAGGAVRASFSIFNTPEDVDALVAGVTCYIKEFC